MPTHHACHACGRDLTRLRAPPDPHYGLPVVTCPGCRTSVVRRREPLVAGWRRTGRAVRAVLALAFQASVLALTTTAACSLFLYIAETASEHHRANPLLVPILHADQLRPEAEGPLLLVLLGVLMVAALFSGVWIRSALAHLRPTWTWLCWVALPLGCALLPAVLHLLWTKLSIGSRSWGSAADVRRVPDVLSAAALYAAFIPLGFPLGRSARSAWRANKAARRARLRRRRRRLREDR